jgi:hypothetical protein
MRRAFSIRQPEARVEEVIADAPSCRHHWLIEAPQGSTSKGICKVCGENREFRNSSDDIVWESESPAVNRSAWGRTGVITGAAARENTAGDY